MSFQADILTLYPAMFPGPLAHALAGRALERGDWSLAAHDIREHAADKHFTVDDTPAGGGAGMVLRADVLGRAIDGVDKPGPKLLMSPRGKPLTQARVRELAAGPGVTLVCGRFEGVDQRVIDARGLEEVSVGDYILAGGEMAAFVLLDAIIRLLPGVMGNRTSGDHESFETGAGGRQLLEHPHYTRPAVWEGIEIPPVLTSGNHSAIDRWRLQQAEALTRERRPDLLGDDGENGSDI